MIKNDKYILYIIPHITYFIIFRNYISFRRIKQIFFLLNFFLSNAIIFYNNSFIIEHPQTNSNKINGHIVSV